MTDKRFPDKYSSSTPQDRTQESGVPMIACERCGHDGWLYLLHGSVVCRACWIVTATDEAIERGEHRLNLSEMRRVCESVGHLLIASDPQDRYGYGQWQDEQADEAED